MVWKALLVFLGSLLGSIVFLLVACLWVGSPIQDLIVSSHGNLVNLPSHKLTPEQLDDLMVLIEHRAVLPAENLIEHIVGFYSSLINVLIGLMTAIGVIAYMYIRASFSDEAEKQIKAYLEGDAFMSRLEQAIRKDYRDAHELYSEDVQASLSSNQDSIEEVRRSVAKNDRRLRDLEKAFQNEDLEDNEGGDLELEVPPP